MDELDSMREDYRVAGLSTGRHPMVLAREGLAARGVVRAGDLAGVPTGRRVRVGGQLIVRQRPGSAKGFFFITLEDETGFANAIVTPAHFTAHRRLLVSASALVVEGVLQRLDGTLSVKADRFYTFDTVPVPSRDFH